MLTGQTGKWLLKRKVSVTLRLKSVFKQKTQKDDRLNKNRHCIKNIGDEKSGKTEGVWRR